MKRKITVSLLLICLLSVLCIASHARTQAQLSYVTDAAGLLTAEQCGALETLCENISRNHQCGVYVVTVEDHLEFGSDDVYTAAAEIYHTYQLGEGDGRDGLILLLSMKERDFALFVYGDGAQYAFDETGQKKLEDSFLPLLKENDWIGGFRAYVTTCGQYLALAKDGDPVRKSPAGSIAIAAAGSFLLSFAVVSFLKKGMKNVTAKAEAGAYLSGELQLTKRVDQFTHKTESRTKITSDTGSSSKARSGGGGSGRSGKF